MIIEFPREKYSVVDRRDDMVHELFTDFTQKCIEMGCCFEDEEFLENAADVLSTMRYLVDSQLGLNFESSGEEQECR